MCNYCVDIIMDDGWVWTQCGRRKMCDVFGHLPEFQSSTSNNTLQEPVRCERCGTIISYQTSDILEI